MSDRGSVLRYNLICLFTLVLIAFCSVQAQECGTVAPGSGGVPWQAGIFENTTRPSIPFGYIWLCGGSLISDNVIISSALKLWTASMKSIDYTKPPSTFKVMVGHISRTWLVPKDDTVQTSDVLDIHTSPGFNDDRIKFSSFFYLNVNDIAVVIVADPFRFNDFIRPVCLDFDYGSELQQLRRGNKGKIVGWGSTVGPDKRPVLQTQDLDYVEDDECVVTNSNFDDMKELTVRWHRDKFCVAVQEQTSAICVKDYGVGIAFPLTKNGVERYYLRGVFSWPLIPKKFCTNQTFYAFTSPRLHESFIKKYWNETQKTPLRQIGNCKLPPTPEYGSFAINVTRPKVTGSEDFVLVSLTLTCQEGFGVVGGGTIHCYNGFWPDSGSSPSCIRMCQLKPHPSVEYRCLVAGEDVSTRACGYYEPVGVTVNPRCRQHFYSASTLTFMKCKEDGHWDYMAKCMPDCGRITPDGQELVVGGDKVMKGEIPWHAGIYTKTKTPYMQICGGSIISVNIIISAAHCFYTDLEKQQPANQFAVAVGKINRPWNDAVDEAQKSDVKRIHLPRRYQGAGASFQDDIAVVVLTDPIQYKTFVRPVCLNFDANFDRLQLQTINKGKVAGWGLTAADGKASPLLRAVDLPYVEVGTCLANSPPDFREYITSDKICAGTQEPNSALCKGDSGGGLAFPTTDHGTERYYLRGVVSTAPKNDHVCNTYTYTSFTQVTKHENFIKPFLTES